MSKGKKKGSKKARGSKKSKSDKDHDRRETNDVGQASHVEQEKLDVADPGKPLSKKQKRKLKKEQRKKHTSSDNAPPNSSQNESIEPSTVVPGESDTNPVPGESDTNPENLDDDGLFFRTDKADQCHMKGNSVNSSKTSRNSDQQNTGEGKQQVPDRATEVKGIGSAAEKEVDMQPYFAQQTTT